MAGEHDDGQNSFSTLTVPHIYMPLTLQRDVEGYGGWRAKSGHIALASCRLADKAVWRHSSVEMVRGRGSSILGALLRTVGWGQSAKPSSHLSIIKSVTVNIFWHKRLGPFISTEDHYQSVRLNKSNFSLNDRSVWKYKALLIPDVMNGLSHETAHTVCVSLVLLHFLLPHKNLNDSQGQLSCHSYYSSAALTVGSENIKWPWTW